MYLLADLGNANLSNIAKYFRPIANIAKIFLPHCTCLNASSCLAVISSWLKGPIHAQQHERMSSVIVNFELNFLAECSHSSSTNPLSKRFFSFPQPENIRSTVMDDIHHNNFQSLISAMNWTYSVAEQKGPFDLNNSYEMSYSRFAGTDWQKSRCSCSNASKLTVLTLLDVSNLFLVKCTIHAT